ncbi:MAG: glycosyltransferase family 4 protein [Burkholderiales bacterium]
MGFDSASGFAGLRIALVGPLPPPAGGMANQTRQLAELLRAAQAEVALVQTNAPYPAWVAALPGVRALWRLLPYLLLLWRTAGRSDVFHVMANSGWSWHLFAAPAIWVASSRGVPVVVNYRGGEAADFLARAQKWVERSMRRVATLVVPSRFLQEVFDRYGMKSQVVPNIIDLSRFSPPTTPRARHTGPHLVVARNLEAIYDNATALRAFAQVRAIHPQAMLTVAGSGPLASELQALARELNIASSVTFAGRLDRDAMAELYRQADVCLNPSLADNMPNSVLEALASGVPVVSTRVGGVPFIVQDGVTALLVPPQDPTAMAQAVQRLLAEPALKSTLVDAGLLEVQRYTWSRVAPLLANVYRQSQHSAEQAQP